MERTEIARTVAENCQSSPSSGVLDHVLIGDSIPCPTQFSSPSGFDQTHQCRSSQVRRRHQLFCSCPVWKRVIDIGGASLSLVLLLPLLIGVSAFIKCVSKGPLFFRQRRFGARGQSFMLWKFRTVEINDVAACHRSHVSELMTSNEPLTKRDYELAIIPGGYWLRKFGLDELPQLINVLKGEMSLVGPRPDVVPPRNYQSWQRRRFDVVPGMTGLWQVCGKNETTFSTMMRLDVLYVRRRSLWLDLVILLRTIPALVRN